MSAGAGADGPAGRVDHWAPGSHILWRYRENGGPHPHIARPVTVVRDDAELLAVWLAPGTECVKPVLADGTPGPPGTAGHALTEPRTVQRDRWFGAGVLKLAGSGRGLVGVAVLGPGLAVQNWYVNLEEPLTRWEGGVDSEDHFLDVSVHPTAPGTGGTRTSRTAQRDRLMDPALAERVRRAGRAAVAEIPRLGDPVRRRLGALAPRSGVAGTGPAGGLGSRARARLLADAATWRPALRWMPR
ncbi:hypothetical protein SVIOM342S_01005 [Streptomyces violaceorubidus]